MKTTLLTLLLILLAFGGMALGLLFGRRGLRGGCSKTEHGICTKEHHQWHHHHD